MNRQQRISELVNKSQMHARYSRNCKRAVWHQLAYKQCQAEIRKLVEAERSERRTVQGRLDNLYQ